MSVVTPAEVDPGARVNPLRRLGTSVRGMKTADEILRTAGLDWEVEKQPLKYGDGNVVIPDRVALVRDTDAKVMGIVGADYHVLQNRESLRFAQDLIDTDEVVADTAGELRGGKWPWISLKMPGEVLIGGEDLLAVYLLVTSSHDGSRSLTNAVTPIRVICENTLNMALATAEYKWSVRHTSTMEGRLQEARKALDLSFKYVEEFTAQSEVLMAAPFSEREFRALAEQLTDKEKKQDKLVERFLLGETTGGQKTKWGALNAIVEEMDWGRNKKPHAQVMGTVYGATLNARNRALEVLTA